jgi:hypothetical protein
MEACVLANCTTREGLSEYYSKSIHQEHSNREVQQRKVLRQKGASGLFATRVLTSLS